MRAKAPVQGAGGHHSSLGSEAAAAAAAAAGQHAGAGRPGAARGPPGLPPLPPARNPEESLRLLGQGKGAADEKAAELKFRLAEMVSQRVRAKREGCARSACCCARAAALRCAAAVLTPTALARGRRRQ